MKRKLTPKQALEASIIRYVDANKSRMMIAHASYNYMVVLVGRIFTTVETIAPDSFQPHTKQVEVQIPVPVALTFSPSTALDGLWTKRFHRLGGDTILVKTLRDAVEALG